MNLFDQKFVPLLGQSPHNFMVIEGNSNKLPPYFPPELLRSLVDITVRYGYLDIDPFGKAAMSLQLPPMAVELYNAIGNGSGGCAGFMLSRLTGEPFMDCSAGMQFLKLYNGMQIMWGESLSIRDIGHTIYEFDKMLYEEGFIVGGKRVFAAM